MLVISYHIAYKQPLQMLATNIAIKGHPDRYYSESPLKYALVHG